ncbi:MAG: complex I subunit 5 family protein [Bacillota bacterium]
MNGNFLLLILIPMVTAFLIPLADIIYDKIRRILVITAVCGELMISIILLIYNYKSIYIGGLLIEYKMGGWLSSLGITLVLDNLSLFFTTLISLSLFLIIFYSIGFIGHHEGKYYVLLFLLLAAMQGAVLTGDIFNLYVFIELITITSAALVAFKRNREAAEAAFKYLLYGVIGGLIFFIGVFLIYYNLGSLNMSIISNRFINIDSGMQYTIIIFFLTSLFIKAGIFPFHYWLPKENSACTAPINAVLSGVLLKVFIYLFFRLFWKVFDYSIIMEINLNTFIIFIGLLSSTIGHFLALREDDIRRLLGFSTIGHIGMIVAVIALNTNAGIFGGLMHVISHSVMKATLFVVTGYILQYTGSSHIADFNGVAYKNQGIFIAFILAAMGMIGIPPLPGFFSKWYIISAFIGSGHYFAAFLIIILSVISIFYYLRYIFRGYNLIDYERGIKPQKAGLVLSVFYRERIVVGVAYTYTFIMILSGVLFWTLRQPLLAIIDIIIGG